MRSVNNVHNLYNVHSSVHTVPNVITVHTVELYNSVFNLQTTGTYLYPINSAVRFLADH